MRTESDFTISSINESVFYKEFTFNRNNFALQKGQNNELSDNVVLLDEIKIIIEIKERNADKANNDVNKWFENKVILKSKKQIKKTVSFFENNDEIFIQNRKKQRIKIPKSRNKDLHKVIIYDVKEQLSEKNRNRKFYKSRDIGYIHIFKLVDYYWVCKYLITPAELNEYLIFREKFITIYQSILNELKEQYLLSHFIATDSDFTIKKEYANILNKINREATNFDIYDLINYFTDKINIENPETNYSYLFKEICKLKRTELKYFKERYYNSIQSVNNNENNFYRFVAERTNCGFVFLCLNSKSYSKGWNKKFSNFTELYKYRHKLEKCVGIVFYKNIENLMNIDFCYFENEWEYDTELEKIAKEDNKKNGESKIVKLKRYSNK
tara:strand:+ start:74 stop:1222 length:1149 start_codon:yes stop_codon:yes gene_type:complete